MASPTAGLDVLQREASASSSPLHLVAERAADGLLALRAVGDQALDGLVHRRKGDLEEAHGLGEGRKRRARRHGDWFKNMAQRFTAARLHTRQRQASYPCRRLYIKFLWIPGFMVVTKCDPPTISRTSGGKSLGHPFFVCEGRTGPARQQRRTHQEGRPAGGLAVSRIAHTTSDWPRRTSPAAKTLSTLVR